MSYKLEQLLSDLSEEPHNESRQISTDISVVEQQFINDKSLQKRVDELESELLKAEDKINLSQATFDSLLNECDELIRILDILGVNFLGRTPIAKPPYIVNRAYADLYKKIVNQKVTIKRFFNTLNKFESGK